VGQDSEHDREVICELMCLSFFYILFLVGFGVKLCLSFIIGKDFR